MRLSGNGSSGDLGWSFACFVSLQSAMTPKQHTIRLRIWQHCDPIGWDCSLDECAKAIGLGLPAVRAVVCMSPSWLGRFRASGGAVKRAAKWSMHANDTTTSADVGDLFGEAFGTVRGAFEE